MTTLPGYYTTAELADALGVNHERARQICAERGEKVFGQWVVAQDDVADLEPSRSTCAKCGRELPSGDARRRYCSDACGSHVRGGSRGGMTREQRINAGLEKRRRTIEEYRRRINFREVRK